MQHPNISAYVKVQQAVRDHLLQPVPSMDEAAWELYHEAEAVLWQALKDLGRVLPPALK